MQVVQNPERREKGEKSYKAVEKVLA